MEVVNPHSDFSNYAYSGSIEPEFNENNACNEVNEELCEENDIINYEAAYENEEGEENDMNKTEEELGKEVEEEEETETNNFADKEEFDSGDTETLTERFDDSDQMYRGNKEREVINAAILAAKAATEAAKAAAAAAAVATDAAAACSSCRSGQYQEFPKFEGGDAAQIAGLRPSQSPIAISVQRCPTWTLLEPLRFNGYSDNPNNATITNTGSTAYFTFPQGERPKLAGGPLLGEYIFEQLHFHWSVDDFTGCEHVLDGHGYASEAHFVHYNSKYGSIEEAVRHPDGLAVVGFLLQSVDAPNPHFDTLIAALDNIRQQGQTVELSAENEVDLEALALLNDQQVAQLIPAIGPQAKFKKTLYNWKTAALHEKSLKGIDLEDSDDIERIISDYGSSVDGLKPTLTSPLGTPTSSPSTASDISLKPTYGNLNALLHKSHDGRLLLKQQLQPLGEQFRKILTREIAAEIIRKDPQLPVTANIYAHWIQEISGLAWLDERDLYGNYVTYKGSLTTEPYTECVTWIIYETPVHIGSEQLGVFRQLEGSDRQLIERNVRPTQRHPPGHSVIKVEQQAKKSKI